ncbi:MAG: ABC-F family ATP-binding cassette domain-containing protein, partial [FCB group bacterium]|nr:ABC-F family ATP-binding cassette domain-containing protein [FCB group bacterium]
MTLVTAEKISQRFNDQIIFEDVSFTIKTGDKIGLIGKNGSGKTTLFDIIAGLKNPDQGNIYKNKKCLINYAQQEKTQYLEMTLFEYVASARQDLLAMRREINNLEESLRQNPHDKNSLEKLGKIQEKYEHQQGFNFENELKIILIGMGFTPNRYHERLKNFSGGEKNRASLAKILAGRGNLLLLDEPTNHLDIDITCWLEEYLTKTDKNYIIVSHDRTFLNNTVGKIWEINNGKIDFYTGGFEKYLKERSQRKQLEKHYYQKHYYQHQQKEIKRIEDFIQRNMAGQKTKQAQSKLKYLKKIKRLPPPKTDGSGQAFQVKSDRRSYAHVLEVTNLDIGYGDKTIATQIGFDIYRGDKIGIIGPNGSGKTTLLKTLIGEITPVKGEVKLGNNVSVAYFDQELTNLDTERSVLENLWSVDPLSEIYTIRSFLARFGFFGEDVFKPVTLLSGGEKTKLSLARLLYHPANFI